MYIITILVLTIVIMMCRIRIQKLNSKVEELNSTIRDCEIIAGHFGSFDPVIAVREWQDVWDSQIKSSFKEDQKETRREIAYSALSFFQPCPFDDLKSSYFDEFVKEVETLLLIKCGYTWKDELSFHGFIPDLSEIKFTELKKTVHQYCKSNQIEPPMRRHDMESFCIGYKLIV